MYIQTTYNSVCNQHIVTARYESIENGAHPEQYSPEHNNIPDSVSQG